MGRKRYRNIIPAFVVMVFMVLTACNARGQTEDSANADEIFDTPRYEWGKVSGKTITIWGDGADLDRPYNTREFQRYEELTGNRIEVVKLTKEELDQKLPAVFSAASEEAPDMLFTYGGTNVENLKPEENFYDFIDAPWVDDLTNTAINQSIFNGMILGLPHGEASVSGMLYNQEIFKKLGLKIPENQDEFLEVCETLLKNEIIPVYLPYKEITMLLYQFPMDSILQNPEVLDGLNNGSLSYSQIPEMKTIVEWYKTMADSGYFGIDYEENDWNGMDEALKSGDYAMMICWDTWLYTTYSGDASKIGLMPAFIGVPERGCFEGANSVLFIANKKSPDLDAVLDFINYLADPVNYNKAYEGIYTAPVYNNQIGSITTPQYMEAERLIEKEYYYSTAWLRVKGFSQYDAVFIQDYMKGNCTVEECLEAMEAKRRSRSGITP